MLLWPFNKYPGTDYETYNWEWLIDLGKKMEKALHDLFSDTGALHRMVNKVLGEHPEWVTTVTDHSITAEKIHQTLMMAIENGYVTPEMYGAVGDGITDDTSAISQALASGKNVYFTANEYKCGPVVINEQNCITIFSSGSLLKFPPNTNNKKWLSLYKCSNITIMGIKFDGNRENQQMVTDGDTRLQTENCPCILIDECENINIYDVECYDAQGDGIQIDRLLYNQVATNDNMSRNIEIAGCKFDAVGRNGVSVIHAEDVNIHDNEFKNIQLFSTSIASGVDVEPNPTGNFSVKHVQIHDNTAHNCRTGFAIIASQDATINSVCVKNNEATECFRPLYAYNNTGDNLKFIGNNVDQCTCGFCAAYAHNIDIINNIIRNLTESNTSENQIGIYIAGSCDHLNIIDNYIESDGLYTMLLAQPDHINIINNYLNGDNHNGAHIIGTGQPKQCRVFNNTFLGDKMTVQFANGTDCDVIDNITPDRYSVTATECHNNHMTFDDTGNISYTPSSTELEYIGHYIDIPAHTYAGINIRTEWMAGMPQGIRIGTSETGMGQVYAESSTGSLNATLYTETALRLYVWAKWNATGETGYRIRTWMNS